MYTISVAVGRHQSRTNRQLSAQKVAARQKGQSRRSKKNLRGWIWICVPSVVCVCAMASCALQFTSISCDCCAASRSHKSERSIASLSDLTWHYAALRSSWQPPPFGCWVGHFFLFVFLLFDERRERERGVLDEIRALFFANTQGRRRRRLDIVRSFPAFNMFTTIVVGFSFRHVQNGTNKKQRDDLF
jgi:hypothetical protein